MAQHTHSIISSEKNPFGTREFKSLNDKAGYAVQSTREP